MTEPTPSSCCRQPLKLQTSTGCRLCSPTLLWESLWSLQSRESLQESGTAETRNRAGRQQYPTPAQPASQGRRRRLAGTDAAAAAAPTVGGGRGRTGLTDPTARTGLSRQVSTLLVP